MHKYIWLLVLTIPPWVAVKFEASKWIVMLAVAPFFVLAMRMGDPEEELLGESFSAFRKGTLLVVVGGGLVLGIVLFILWRVFFHGA